MLHNHDMLFCHIRNHTITHSGQKCNIKNEKGGEKMELVIPTMLTVDEASERTRLSSWYLRKLCKEGKIVHVMNGVKPLINLEKLVEFLNTGYCLQTENNTEKEIKNDENVEMEENNE